jgi:hypothetical protein
VADAGAVGQQKLAANFLHQHHTVSYEPITPRSARISSTSRRLRPNTWYSQTVWLIDGGSGGRVATSSRQDGSQLRGLSARRCLIALRAAARAACRDNALPPISGICHLSPMRPKRLLERTEIQRLPALPRVPAKARSPTQALGADEPRLLTGAPSIPKTACRLACSRRHDSSQRCSFWYHNHKNRATATASRRLRQMTFSNTKTNTPARGAELIWPIIDRCQRRRMIASCQWPLQIVRLLVTTP